VWSSPTNPCIIPSIIRSQSNNPIIIIQRRQHNFSYHSGSNALASSSDTITSATGSLLISRSSSRAKCGGRKIARFQSKPCDEATHEICPGTPKVSPRSVLLGHDIILDLQILEHQDSQLQLQYAPLFPTPCPSDSSSSVQMDYCHNLLPPPHVPCLPPCYSCGVMVVRHLMP
jgi:hypothetical protein